MTVNGQASVLISETWAGIPANSRCLQQRCLHHKKAPAWAMEWSISCSLQLSGSASIYPWTILLKEKKIKHKIRLVEKIAQKVWWALCQTVGCLTCYFFRWLFGVLADTAAVCQWLSLLFPYVPCHSPSPYPAVFFLALITA